MAAEILRKYEWNGHEYCVVQYSDGSRITLKGEIGQYDDAAWIALAIALAADNPEPEDPMITLLQSCPNQMLIDEVVRRHLVIAVEGEV